VPENLIVPEGNRAFFIAHAVGTQDYICLAAGQAWTFIGPQATSPPAKSNGRKLSISIWSSPRPTRLV
jgi:hypothetical protein